MGLTKLDNHLHCAFSKREEKAMAKFCLIKARMGSPMTIPDFIEFASFLAGKDPSRPFSRKFVTGFVKRNRDVIAIRHAKITSPTRRRKMMKVDTETFIEMFNRNREKNLMNVNNIVVFDETIISEPPSLPLVLCERRKSGGGNANVYRVQGKALGCYIPFSLANGTTPFRVFIFRTGRRRRGVFLPHSQVPRKEYGQSGHPHRLILQSRTGYLTIGLFKRIMQEFINWWKIVNPGLECFLICDNLRVHCSDSIVKAAKAQGIHLINIMSGSSHWFQVHDDLPFATLKKKMKSLKNRILYPISAQTKARRRALMKIFYDAEREAFAPTIIRKAFDNVGLWPWNPEKIRQHCKEHSPPKEDDVGSNLERGMLAIIEKYEQKKLDAFQQLLTGLVPANVIEVDEESECGSEEESAEEQVDDDEDSSAPTERRKRGRPKAPQAKRPRTSSNTRNTKANKQHAKKANMGKKAKSPSKHNKKPTHKGT